MARIAGVDIPRDKRLDISLRHIYGIGDGEPEVLALTSEGNATAARAAGVKTRTGA